MKEVEKRLRSLFRRYFILMRKHIPWHLEETSNDFTLTFHTDNLYYPQAMVPSRWF